jgi:hypothetical protein
MEYKSLSVRSMRAPRNRKVIKMVKPMNSTASASKALAPVSLRPNLGVAVVMG